MNQKIASLMLLSIVLLSGCGPERPATDAQSPGESPSKQVTTQPEQETGARLIMASKNGEVKLYAAKETKNGTKGVTLNINGSQKEFDWNYPGDTGNDPQVFYTDVTGDGREEAVIIIHIGKGTGLNNYDIHVVNAKDLSEIKVQSYEDIVADQIESHVAKNNDGTLAIRVKTQGKEYNFNYDFDPAPDYSQEKLAFGGVLVYTLENQKIKLYVPGSVGVSPHYVSDFNVTYKFDSVKNEFIVDQIEVEPIEN